MSKLYDTWARMGEMAQQSPDPQAYWKEYDDAETEVYRQLLKELADGNIFTGTVEEMAAHYGMEPELFVGFLEGINGSLKEPLEMEQVEADTVVNWEVLPEKLFFNMNDAKASWLYTLEEWNEVLPEEKRRAITKEWRLSKQVRNEEKPGRNDPCPCGSGKKYKKCCMLKESANA